MATPVFGPMLWHIGNTTVRTPYRLRHALLALRDSPLHGNLCTREHEGAFARLLHEQGVLNAPRVEGGEDASDLGRKWRSALSQLGFLTPKLTRTLSSPVDPKLSVAVQGMSDLSGRPFEITPNGHRLIESSSTTAQQECFLRALAVYRIPSPLETKYDPPSFSPLRFVLQILHALEAAARIDPFLSFQEIAFFVERHTHSDDVQEIAWRIREYRDARDRHDGSVRTFDSQFIANLLREEHQGICAETLETKRNTLNDYADLIIRYLKATGLFKGKGRGITLAPARVALANMLRESLFHELEGISYLQALWAGAELPTDDRLAALTVIEDLTNQIRTRGGQVEEMDTAAMDVAQLSIQRHQLEDLILRMDEEAYADEQSEHIDEILAWLEGLLSRGTATLPTGERVTIPKGEAPAYLEWIVWRAFLAINSLRNKPWEARRFQIDQDFFPIGTAPGGGPDMVFEFENMNLVVEVTLTSSSRQEAAEGEPVRRHVAKYAEEELESGKIVYGLFIAINIDTNTAHTFRSGDWYLPDDQKISLDIIPLRLEDFRALLSSGKRSLPEMPQKIETFLMRCRARANQDAPRWKTEISGIVGNLFF
jgi:hypothetical protein